MAGTSLDMHHLVVEIGKFSNAFMKSNSGIFGKLGTRVSLANGHCVSGKLRVDEIGPELWPARVRN